MSSPDTQFELFDLTPRVHGRKVTKTTSQAAKLLNRHRGNLITKARAIAIDLAKANGTVHSREVRAEMDKQGHLTNPALADHWLGVVFRSSVFVWTGQYFSYRDDSRNVHERTVKVWKLREN
jgi:hypothetical protein